MPRQANEVNKVMNMSGPDRQLFTEDTNAFLTSARLAQATEAATTTEDFHRLVLVHCLEQSAGYEIIWQQHHSSTTGGRHFY
jgi:hypothetical protein